MLSPLQTFLCQLEYSSSLVFTVQAHLCSVAAARCRSVISGTTNCVCGVLLTGPVPTVHGSSDGLCFGWHYAEKTADVIGVDGCRAGVGFLLSRGGECLTGNWLEFADIARRKTLPKNDRAKGLAKTKLVGTWEGRDQES